MAAQGTVVVKFSDGEVAYLVNNSLTETDGSGIISDANNVQTGGTGLAQVTGVDLGQAYVGKVATSALAVVANEDSNALAYMGGFILNPQGRIKMIIQGGGSFAGPIQPLKRPVTMEVGDTMQILVDGSADGATQAAAVAVYCADGTCDFFMAKIVNDTKTAMLNKDGATIGQALTGKTVTCYYGTVSTGFNVNESQAGNAFFYVEKADGVLKGVIPPSNTGSSGSDINQSITYYNECPFRVEQNDTLSVMGSHS
tara:strand:+ start:220 stop:984 length:765 start_codon:yes stop_codon:yes gene_type:complete